MRRTPRCKTCFVAGCRQTSHVLTVTARQRKSTGSKGMTTMVMTMMSRLMPLMTSYNQTGHCGSSLTIYNTTKNQVRLNRARYGRAVRRNSMLMFPLYGGSLAGNCSDDLFQ
ncbi:hypothetical protein HMPREF1589_02873 [Escherichia coli 113290]|uniref:Uncharacterized protein n=1 Tax=Salmonella hadar TaxID=149385 RepID=H8WF44_SALHA|nr:hypothetical protein HMPREF1589_02873 [Escherichia coli 113290]CBW53097.1 hypothetical protein SHAD28522 [Salmonella enterica subsp. enterica serovar Hadar]